MLLSARERDLSRSIPLAAAAAVALVAIALPLAAALNIWQDEAFTLHTTARGVAYAFREALGFEQSAPAYFMALALWRAGGEAVWYLRGFSILCAAGAVACVPGLTRRYLPQIDLRITTLAAVWNPLPVWAAIEMRPYALIMLCSAALLLTFYDAFLAERKTLSAVVAFTAVSVISLYTQFYLAFLIIGLGIALAIYRRASLLAYFAAGAVTAVAFAPLVAIVPSQVANFRSPFPAPSLALSLASLALPMAKFALPAPLPLKMLALIVACAVVAIVVASRVSLRSPLWVLPVAAGASALLFAFVTHAAGVVVLGRHVTSLYVISLLSVYALIAMLRAPLRTRAALLWCVAGLVASTAALATTYAPLAKPGDWIRLDAYLESRERPGQPIAVFEAENALPFAYYYRGPNRIIPIPTGVDFRRYDLAKFIVHDDAILARSFPRDRFVWLVRTGDCRADGISYGCAIVDDFVRARYRTLEQRAFYRSSVSLLERR